MEKDLYGNPILNEQELFDALYSDSIKNLSDVIINDSTYLRFTQSARTNLETFELPKKTSDNQSLENFDRQNQENWFMPKHYCTNLIESIYELCKTDKERDRVSLELELFMKHKMLDVLFFLKYLVDIMRTNNIVWGVGRGSCVSSYVLYLIGVHKIDSLKYNLEITEFLK